MKQGCQQSTTTTYNKKCSSKKGLTVFLTTLVDCCWGGSSTDTVQYGSQPPAATNITSSMVPPDTERSYIPLDAKTGHFRDVLPSQPLTTVLKRLKLTQLQMCTNKTKCTIKFKPIWIVLEQEIMGWQWHQLDHMQIICTLLIAYVWCHSWSFSVVLATRTLLKFSLGSRLEHHHCACIGPILTAPQPAWGRVLASES